MKPKHYAKENFFLYWNNKQQRIPSNVAAIKDYILNSINCYGVKLEQFEIRSTYKIYSANEFLKII